MTIPPPNYHYNRLRKFLGWMGITLPVVLLIGSYATPGCGELQCSISAYYHTHLISVFCGFLFAIGIFLFTYTGPTDLPPSATYIDRMSSNIAGVFALGVAIFPTGLNAPIKNCNTQIGTWWNCSEPIHVFCAGALFLTLAFISYKVFTISTRETPTSEKLFRNRIYRLCAIVMVLCIALAGICILNEEAISTKYPNFKPIFILETIMLVAFGISWLLKGETFFADGSEGFQKVPEVFKPKKPLKAKAAVPLS
jgi:hypothetical protein